MLIKEKIFTNKKIGKNFSLSFNSSDPLDIRDLNEIYSKLWDARNKWFSIGLGLNLEYSDLKEIQQTNRDDVEKCFMDMLEKWLRTSLRPMQSNLITVLREQTVGFNQLAEELESNGLKRDRVIHQLRMAPTTGRFAPSLVRYMSDSVIIKIGAATTFLILLFTVFSFARIHYNVISPKDCYATGSGLEVAVVGERAKAVLHLVNRRGAAYTKQVNVISCELIHELIGKILDCEIANHKIKDVGQYEVSYQATDPGRHQLHVKVEEEHIKGSPFTVLVVKTIKTISGVKRPTDMAVNQRGEILVAEEIGHCISIFSPTGDKLGSFGSQGSGPGQFNEPSGVAVDDDGNILVADFRNNRIQKFTSDNKHITSVGSYGSNHLQFNLPTSVSISPITKKIAISDYLNCRVQILNPDLTFHSSIGSKGSGNGQFYGPYDTAFDSEGNLYVTDAENHRIQVFNPEGQFLRKFGKGGKGDGELDFPAGISIDSYDTVYVVDSGNHRVSVFTHKGKFLTSFGSLGNGRGQFSSPYGITMDKQGTIYVAEYDNNRIHTFSKMI